MRPRNYLEATESRREWRAGTIADWKAALAVAHARLCKGTDGVAVMLGQPWSLALSQEAERIMVEGAIGRPKGEPVDAWVALTMEVARYPSTAPDGMVSGPLRMRVPISSLPGALPPLERPRIGRARGRTDFDERAAESLERNRVRSRRSR